MGTIVKEEIRISCYCHTCGHFCRSYGELEIPEDPFVYCTTCKVWVEGPVTKAEPYKVYQNSKN